MGLSRRRGVNLVAGPVAAHDGGLRDRRPPEVMLGGRIWPTKALERTQCPGGTTIDSKGHNSALEDLYRTAVRVPTSERWPVRLLFYQRDLCVLEGTQVLPATLDIIDVNVDDGAFSDGPN